MIIITKNKKRKIVDNLIFNYELHAYVISKKYK